ncbi:MAG: flagellar motor protein MotD [Methylophaga sp.]|nr:MAG: flagellar motor protein MotD [Methylophaga sp.]
MARRRKKQEEYINHERWLVSYADFITLLFAFFVVMYSISSVNISKYRVLSDTLESVFSSPGSTDPIQLEEHDTTAPPVITPINLIELPPTPPPVSEKIIRTINDLAQQFNSTFAEKIENEDISIKQGNNWLELEIKSSALFYSGESRLERTAIPIIAKAAEILKTSSNPVQVEGFTDNQPISTPRFPSNWELSAARAASVVHLLNRYGVSPNRMSAIGYGQFKPIADNTTESGRQKNRRIVLVVLGGDNISRRTIDTFQPTALSPISPIVPAGSPARPVQQPIATGSQ